MDTTPSGAIDIVEIYRYLTAYGVRINGERYPLGLGGMGIGGRALGLPGWTAGPQALPIARVVRVGDTVIVDSFTEGAPGDPAVLEHVRQLVAADATGDHKETIEEWEDVDGHGPYAGGLSRTTLLGLQSEILNGGLDGGILRNY